MNITPFLQMKELDSLLRMHERHRQLSRDEESRISKLDHLRLERERQLLADREQCQKWQSQLHDIEHRLTERLTTEVMSQLEEQGLVLLQQMEELEQTIKDHQTFLTGLAKTRQEILDEVLQSVGIEAKEMANIKQRQELLAADLPANFLAALHKAQARKLTHGPFTTNHNGVCQMCRYTLSRTDQSSIDLQGELKTCQGCGRIFLPYAAVYGQS